MLSIKKMGRGSENYYLDLTGYFLRGRRKGHAPSPDDDDDSDDPPPPGPGGFETRIDLPGEPAGQWMAVAAATLSLGEVFPEELKPLMQGYHPRTGQPLVQNAGAANRVPGWDLTLSAPKSVSIAWSQAEEPLRPLIEYAHSRAVLSTIDLAERELAYSRIGKAGTGYVPVKLAVAAFEHATSRIQDAQLHTHCLVLNVGVDAAGNSSARAWRACSS